MVASGESDFLHGHLGLQVFQQIRPKLCHVLWPSLGSHQALFLLFKALTGLPNSRGGTIDPTFQLETGQGYTVEDHMRWPVSLWVLLGKYHLPNRILGHTLQVMCLIQDWRKLSFCLLSFLSIYSLAVASCPWLLLIFFCLSSASCSVFLVSKSR